MITFKKFGYNFRTVEIKDGAFIYGLRTNSKLNKYLSPITGGIEEQKLWIKKYLEREALGKEYYFITEDNNRNSLGVNRLYNFSEDSFELGSWLFSIEAPLSSAILSDLAIRDYAFEVLKLNVCRFEVRKKNLSVLKYHNQFNPKFESEDELNFYFSLDYNNYVIHRDKLLNILYVER